MWKQGTFFAPLYSLCLRLRTSKKFSCFPTMLCYFCPVLQSKPVATKARFPGSSMISVSSHIASLRAYQPGKSVAEVEQELGITGAVKLASNENPLGSSPLALQAAAESLQHLTHYPDAGLRLRQALAERFVIRPENVICGSGGESIISNALHTFLDGEDEMISSEGTFVGFLVLAHASGKKTHYVPQRNNGYDLDGILRKINDHTKIIYIANPNNPTGTAVTTNALERFMEKVPEHVLVILDEAYFEYADGWPDYPDSMHYRWDNVLTVRTFSKAYGLAGIRIGYGMAHSDIIGKMMKVKLPFEPNTPAEEAGLAALKDEEFLRQTVELNRESVLYYHREFERMGLDFVPTLANFVMITFRDHDRMMRIFNGLMQRGIITRPLTAFGLPNCLRISTGTMEQNARCVAALEEVLNEELVH
ncbi:MAG: histidinol phosphate aminotransferase [Chlorobi bacterium OLB7]|nr:MAG: histidinol phosphate aminotransferase [Chlorobi bacterium OLB7]